MKEAAAYRTCFGVALIVALLGASPAVAGGDKSYLDLALTRSEEDSQRGSAKSSYVVTALNVTAALAISSGFVVGAKYINYGISSDDSFTGGSGADLSLPSQGVTISGYGPLLGYYHDGTGIFAHAAYLIFPSKKTKVSSGTITDDSGSGYVFDLGKSFEVGKNFGVALQLTKMHVDYKKESGPSGVSVPQQTPWWDESLRPYVGIFYYF